MAPPTNTLDDNAAFFAGCINKTKSVQDVYESLGLFPTTKSRKGPEFWKNEANQLHDNIKEIAQAFVERHRDDLEHLQADLSKATFSSEVGSLLHEYGQAIWGQADPGHTRSFREDEGSQDELNWNRNEHRETIRFYIRCWIVTTALRDTGSTPRKGKGKTKPKVTSPPDEEHTGVETPTRSTRSDSSGPSEVPYRAPEPPNMYPIPENRRKDAQPGHSRARSGDLGASTNDERSKNTTIETETGPSTPPWPPNKRKAPDVQDQFSTGKLQKVSREARPMPMPFPALQRDVYSVPRSPTLPLDAAPLSSLTERYKRKEGSYDTDATYMPPSRGFTAETETVVDGDDAVADAIDLVIQSPLACGASMQYEYQDQPVAGPSGTYQNPLRQDSVIPDTQSETVGALSKPTESQTTFSQTIDNSPVHGAAVTQLSAETSSRQQKADRRELFRLLLSYLNSINQFSPDVYDTDAEERMDFLLNQLWAKDTETLRSELGNDFARLEIALKSWMNMRDRLTRFQTTTGYLGQPGEQWKAHLRRMLDIPARAQACIAFDELKTPSSAEGEPQHAPETFDDDLATVFDLLTRVSGCNGAEEFKAIRLYNEALLQWIREE